ncbi:MAG: type II toxin-antitoxin system VapC family toxin [Nitrososphaerota archaeon]
MKLLIDTSFLIALRKGDLKARKTLESLKDKIEDIGISRLTEYELMVGAFYLWKKYGDARELAWLNEVLKWLTIYEVDEEVIKLDSKIKSEALLNGERETIYDIDLLIAVSGKLVQPCSLWIKISLS